MGHGCPTRSTDRPVDRGGGWVAVQLVLFALFLAVSPQPVALPELERRLGLAGLVLGGIVLALSFLSLGRNLSPFPAPKPGGQLVTSGALAWVRHPVYCALLCAAFGWSLWRADAARLVLSAVLAVFFDAKARGEERRLAERFAAYPDYARRVKRFVPGIY